MNTKMSKHYARRLVNVWTACDRAIHEAELLGKLQRLDLILPPLHAFWRSCGGQPMRVGFYLFQGNG